MLRFGVLLVAALPVDKPQTAVIRPDGDTGGDTGKDAMRTVAAHPAPVSMALKKEAPADGFTTEHTGEADDHRKSVRRGTRPSPRAPRRRTRAWSRTRRS